jgi:aryl-alcohol dehydrogenase-like predicted oxidoreductase
LCQEIGATFVAFSPVARGFLTDAPPVEAEIATNDIRKTMPRFMGANYAANLKLLTGFKALANEAGCTPAQFSLAWLLHKAEHIIPIPGTRSVEHLMEDLGAMDVKLGTDVIQRAEALINQKTVAGARYNAQATSEVDTETFA